MGLRAAEFHLFLVLTAEPFQCQLGIGCSHFGKKCVYLRNHQNFKGVTCQSFKKQADHSYKYFIRWEVRLLGISTWLEANKNIQDKIKNASKLHVYNVVQETGNYIDSSVNNL